MLCCGMNELLVERSSGGEEKNIAVRVRVKLLIPEEIRQSLSYSPAPHNHEDITQNSHQTKKYVELDAVSFYMRILQVV